MEATFYPNGNLASLTYRRARTGEERHLSYIQCELVEKKTDDLQQNLWGIYDDELVGMPEVDPLCNLNEFILANDLRLD